MRDTLFLRADIQWLGDVKVQWKSQSKKSLKSKVIFILLSSFSELAAVIKEKNRNIDKLEHNLEKQQDSKL